MCRAVEEDIYLASRQKIIRFFQRTLVVVIHSSLVELHPNLVYPLVLVNSDDQIYTSPEFVLRDA